jgi:hypothetical protein
MNWLPVASRNFIENGFSARVSGLASGLTLAVRPRVGRGIREGR